MIYTRELVEITNLSTSRTRYFLNVNGWLRRVSKTDYDKMWEEADGLDTMHTVSNKTHRKSYRTCRYYTGSDANTGLKEG